METSRRLTPIVLILIIGLISFYRLEERTVFSWDQERDAQVEWKIIKENKLTLIGPRALGPDAFFLGPFWFYLLLPFYLIFNMDPLGAAVFGVITGLVTTVLFYKIGEYFLGFKGGLVSAFLTFSIGGVVVWNPMLIPSFTLIIFYLFKKIDEGYVKLILTTLLLIGLALQLHVQSIFLFIPFLICLWFYKKRYSKYPVKYILIGLVLFLLTLSPLVLFDIRHNFINTKGFLKIFFASNNILNLKFIRHFLENFSKFFAAFSFQFANWNIPKIYTGILILFISIVGIVNSNLVKSVKYIFLSCLLIPPFLFSFYKGDLSEYYFTFASVSVTFGISLFMLKIHDFWSGKIFFNILILLILLNKIYIYSSSFSQTSLLYEKKAVQYIVNQKVDPIFNVSYSAGINGDSGFRYLFKFYGREPQDIPQGHLWTIVIPPYTENVKPVAVFGDIGIIRR